jgi:hypothetical protein
LVKADRLRFARLLRETPGEVVRAIELTDPKIPSTWCWTHRAGSRSPPDISRTRCDVTVHAATAMFLACEGQGV